MTYPGRLYRTEVRVIHADGDIADAGILPRPVRLLGAMVRPRAAWVTQTVRNLVMGLQEAGHRARFLIRDRGGKYPRLFDQVLADAWPLRPLPELIAEPARIARLDVRRRNHLGGALREYQHAA